MAFLAIDKTMSGSLCYCYILGVYTSKRENKTKLADFLYLFVDFMFFAFKQSILRICNVLPLMYFLTGAIFLLHASTLKMWTLTLKFLKQEKFVTIVFFLFKTLFFTVNMHNFVFLLQ